MMTIAILVPLLAASAADVFIAPLPDYADEFLIDIDLDGAGDLAVLDGFDLTVYPTADRDASLKLTFPPNARAFDIVPHPETGAIAILAACGSEIRMFDFSGQSPEEGTVLFEHTSNLSAGDWPYRYVMVFERENESLFFLPSAEAIELRTWSGELRERITPESRDGVQRFEEVKGGAQSTDRFGRTDILEFWVRRDPGNEPPLITEQDKRPSPFERYGTSSLWGGMGAVDSPPEQWPWFTLQPDVEDAPRVRCANRFDPPEAHIRIDATLLRNVPIGPARKYPGMVTRLNAELPDFNGDGYTDLLLWSTDRPSVSVSSIARIAVQQEWPIRLTLHLFDAGNSRYIAKPHASLNLRAAWEMLLRRGSNSPLAASVVDDIDADGRTDLAFTVDATTYVMWLMREDGPEVENIQTSEPIVDLSFAQSFDESGRITIGLRTESHLYVIDPD